MSDFSLKPRDRVRRPSLTPMIDVIFLLLVFFMLASRFGQDAALALNPGGTGNDYSGAPRLVDIERDGVSLNGRRLAEVTLVEALAPLMPTPNALVVLRPAEDVPTQRLIDVVVALRASGVETLAVVE